MVRTRVLLGLIAAVAVSAGCSSNKIEKRGWIGGTTTAAVHPVDDGLLVTKRAEVLTHVPASSPAAQAGLKPSDVVLAIDGERVDDRAEYRELVERRRPGETVHIDVWRCGQRVCVPVVVGCEELCKQRSAMFGLGLAPGQVDLWPFDNGVNVMGVVRATHDDRRIDLDSPREQYLQCKTAAPLARDIAVHRRKSPKSVAFRCG